MIETSRFGATGHQSSRVIFGAAALARVSQEEADGALPLLLEHGINHIDTAAGYGESELGSLTGFASTVIAFFSRPRRQSGRTRRHASRFGARSTAWRSIVSI